MSKMRAILVAAAVSAVAASSYTVASAAPVDGALALRNAAPITIEKARWVGWRGGGWGWRGSGWDGVLEPGLPRARSSVERLQRPIITAAITGDRMATTGATIRIPA